MASFSSSSGHRKYDVFLSFRGKDTRKTFLSHLFGSLRRKGIHTFKDDRNLEKGDSISDELTRAIQESSFAVVVISEDYASSTWCLEELRIIMELWRMNQLVVVPIFYEVVPSDVRDQTGSFGMSFETYTDPRMTEKVRLWRIALTEVSNLAGLVSRTREDEAEMIEELVRGISSRLLYMRPTDVTNIFGMDVHMAKMKPLLSIESKNEIRMIGIWGMGGIGKTTIAKYLYGKVSNEFTAHCFMEDVKGVSLKHGLLHLQEQFLSRILHGENMKFWSIESGCREIKARLASQRVFIVLDDVDSIDQLHALAKESHWFGSGSRIIITTRDKGLLNSCRVETIYHVTCLEDYEILQIFKQAVFEGGWYPYDYEELSVRASQLARGLPSLAVKYGLFLRGRSPEQWKDALSRYKRAPPKIITEIFKISYEGLETQEKKVFLHVACLFNGAYVRRITTLLGDGESGVNHEIDILEEKSLAEKSADGRLIMHDMVEQTGRQIVCQESTDDPWKQIILWDHEKICEVLAHSTGTARNEGIELHMCEIPSAWCVSGSVFQKMYNLRFLKVYKHIDSIQSRLQLTTGINPLPRNLRLLHWDAYPMKAFHYRFHPGSLVELNLRFSNLETLWKGTLELPKLRRLDLTGSKNLKKLPDLSKAEQLEELRIRDCIALKLPPLSIDNLSHLQIFDYNEWLECLPTPTIPQKGSRIRRIVQSLWRRD